MWLVEYRNDEGKTTTVTVSAKSHEDAAMKVRHAGKLVLSTQPAPDDD